ncbi:hypothetical protein CD351_03655 [Erythrobacter sp. KY5]|uniref:hypothetical protein n=1 Tax=Erythrobacter sp. KY5 TaxID=2011159 RepID=UPI000DBEF5B4|nr:hypothetical protein [Erythrobacter sp. KY5]AWW73521.1 hypothetical protein CD351_03655 [Erythrobacter sp. KY5]
MTRRLARAFTHLFALLAFAWSGAALAEVQIHFHSFNGSVLFGRYPHTFIVLDGTVDATGEAVNENYGFTARSVTAAATRDWVEHLVEAEPEKYISRTNRHFSITLTDEQYYAIIREVRRWSMEPGKRYSLSERNCIHFVGEMARVLGLRVEYPEDMLRRPKRWLNHITALNPQLGAEPI